MLAEKSWEASEAKRELEERSANLGFVEDILELLAAWDPTNQEIADAVGLSRTYISEILAGQKVPSLEHWDAFARLADRA